MKKIDKLKFKLRGFLLDQFASKDITKHQYGLSAPCLLLKVSNHCEKLEITIFDAPTGKHYSAWYFIPNSLEAFNTRVDFTKQHLNKKLYTL